VPLAKVLDLRQHPPQQKLSGSCPDAGALKLQDLFALSSDLDAHVLDFGTNVIYRHGAPSILSGSFG